MARPLWRELALRALGRARLRPPPGFEFLGKDELTEGRSPGELESEAIRNLRERPASWQDLELDLGGFRRLKMLVATDDFTAERILDPAFLLEAQGALNASGLLVAVPRRGFLAVTALDTNVERVHTFGAVAATQFQGGESAPVTPALFTVRNGQITGAVDVVARAVVPPEQMVPTSQRLRSRRGDAPRSSEITRLPMRWIISRSCVATTTVVPRAFTSRNSRMISWAISGSRLPVGSSASSSIGSLMRARAIATRCCSPPDSCSG